jgi:anti-sigma factor RsiW
MSMTCGEVENLLEAFVDGELPGGAMRETARHLARCPSCETMAVRLERVQETVRQAVLGEVEEPDTVASWNVIAPRLAASSSPPPRWRERFGSAREWLRFRGLPASVWIGSAAAAIVAMLLWAGNGQPPADRSQGFQLFPRQARIDLLDASSNVRVWNQPDSGALVIWVDEQRPNVEPVAQ